MGWITTIRSRWAALRERSRQVRKVKSLDVEETIDVTVHRPIAAIVTLALSRFKSVTPNHVTFASLGVGWSGGLMLYLAVTGRGPLSKRASFAASAGLIFSSVVLDCADGQLARLRGSSTPFGRALDGMVDVLVFIPIFVINTFANQRQVPLAWRFWPSLLAGVSCAYQTNVYDRIRLLYLAHTHPNPAGIEGSESIDEVRAAFERALADKRPLEIAVRAFYYNYQVFLNENVAPESAIPKTPKTPEEIEAFRRAHLPMMRQASWLGTGAHLATFYTTIACSMRWPAAVYGAMFAFAVPFNVLLVRVLRRTRSLRQVD